MHKTKNMSTIKEKDMTRVIEIEKGRTVKNIEVSDGRVVINYEEEFCPKDGDFVAGEFMGLKFLSIHKSRISDKRFNYHVTFGMDNLLHRDDWADAVFCTRFQTESEKQQLLDALAKEGLTWNAEKKAVEKKRWKAKEGDAYWYCEFSYKSAELEPKRQFCGIEKDFDDANFRMGDCFRTKEDCQKLCDILNKTIADFMNK
jgi:hypothetical protein